MEREGLDGFGSKPPPMTQFQEEQQLLTMSAIEVWLRSWVVSQEGAEVTMTSAKCFETFVAWTKLNMAEYSCTSMQFGVRLTRLKIKGITSIRNKTSDKTFNINDMFEHFGISRD